MVSALLSNQHPKRPTSAALIHATIKKKKLFNKCRVVIVVR